MVADRDASAASQMPGDPGEPDMEAAQLLAAVRAATDRSSRSDQLAAGTGGWEYRRHLSRLRGNLLLPLRIGPGINVLEVAAGSGALTRALAETGASLTALAESPELVPVVSQRVSGMANCRVVGSSLEQFRDKGHEGEFDLVLLFSPSAADGDEQAAMIRSARTMLKQTGALVAVTDNPVGLRNLLGFPDQQARPPWIGLEGLREASGLVRRRLAGLLNHAGLGSQQWIYPYPDRWEPKALVRHELFDSDEGRQLIRLFVRSPVSGHGQNSPVIADPVAAFATMLEAGLGPDTASSFLVVAASDPAHLARIVNSDALWVSTGERLSRFMDVRRVAGAPGAWRLVPSEGAAEVQAPPLTWRRDAVDLILGSNLEDKIVAAAARAVAPAQLRPIIAQWWAAALPWLDAQGQGAGYHLDVMPRNFVRGADDALVYVDREWIWAEPVPPSWALLRACWFLLLERLFPAGATAGLPLSGSAGDAVLVLAQLADPTLGPSQLWDAVALESRLQALVTGSAVDDERKALVELLQAPLADLAPPPAAAGLLHRALAAEVRASQAAEHSQWEALLERDEIIGLQAEVETAEATIAELEEKVRWLRGRSPSLALRAKAGELRRRVQDSSSKPSPRR